jgi:hypothetical protein
LPLKLLLESFPCHHGEVDRSGREMPCSCSSRRKISHPSFETAYAPRDPGSRRTKTGSDAKWIALGLLVQVRNCRRVKATARQLQRERCCFLRIERFERQFCHQAIAPQIPEEREQGMVRFHLP